MRRGGSSAAIVAACLLAVASLAASAARASAALPFSGTASWVWYVSDSGGSGAAIGRKAMRRGLDAVYVKSADGTRPWDQFTPGLVEAIHDRGVDVCAWQFVYGDDPAREARVAAESVDDGADCLIIDAESAYEGRYAAADTYVRTLRRRVGDGFPLALSSFPYVDFHPAFPYSVFLGPGGAEYNLPQVYWHTIGDPVPNALGHTYSYNRPYGRTIYPVGQTYENPPGGELRDFRRYARQYGAGGVSWWSWQETSSGEWRSITRRVSRGIKGFEPRRDFADLAPGDAGDLVVWAQELLRGGGFDVRVNGDFDSRTKRAVIALQAESGLPESGEIGDRTWSILLEDEPVRIRWSGRRAPRSAALPRLRDEIPPPRERMR